MVAISENIAPSSSVNASTKLAILRRSLVIYKLRTRTTQFLDWVGNFEIGTQI